ncbi:MAG: hypothetical protein ACYDDQ_12355, partial [Vulcanimicrobiaceae bacterium]
MSTHTLVAFDLTGHQRQIGALAA